MTEKITAAMEQVQRRRVAVHFGQGKFEAEMSNKQVAYARPKLRSRFWVGDL